MAAMTPSGWVVLVASVLLLWGVAGWALVRSLRAEDRKLALLDAQGEIDTYSPSSLRDLRAWIDEHPDDPMAPAAAEAYRDCVETLERIDEYFYDWSDEDVEAVVGDGPE